MPWPVLGLLAALGFGESGFVSAREPVRSLLELRQQQVVLQRHDLSCGAATLATVLTYQHDLPIPERDIALEMLQRSEYASDPDRFARQQGFSLLDLKRFVERRGLVGEGYGRLAFEDLLAMAPAIVPVRLDGYDHFVVFRGIASDRVLVADPAWGNRVMRRDAFVSAWQQVDEFGRVAFVVKQPKPSAESAPHALLPTSNDFALLR